MAGGKYMKTPVKRTSKPRGTKITVGKNPGKAKKLSDLPSYGTAKRKPKKKATGMMAGISKKFKR